MISEWSTVIGFLSLVVVKILGFVAPLDCLGYQTKKERAIILHEAAAKALQAAQIGGKLPNVAVLQGEYAKLQEQKEVLYADYGKLKKQVKEYDVIKRNIDSILNVEHQPERAKETERE